MHPCMHASCTMLGFFLPFQHAPTWRWRTPVSSSPHAFMHPWMHAYACTHQPFMSGFSCLFRMCPYGAAPFCCRCPLAANAKSWPPASPAPPAPPAAPAVQRWFSTPAATGRMRLAPLRATCSRPSSPCCASWPGRCPAPAAAAAWARGRGTRWRRRAAPNLGCRCALHFLNIFLYVFSFLFAIAMAQKGSAEFGVQASATALFLCCFFWQCFCFSFLAEHWALL